MAGFPVKLLMTDCRANKALPRFHKIHHPSQHIWMRFVLFVSLWPFLENFTSLKGPSLASRGQAMGGQCLISSFARRSVSLKTRIGGTRSPVNLLRSIFLGIPHPSAPSRKYLGIRAPLHALPLRCASSPYSTVCLSRAPCWRGASTLSVRQAIHETVHCRVWPSTTPGPPSGSPFPSSPS